MAEELQRVRLRGHDWFVDERLGELRRVDNPSIRREL